MAEQFFDRTAQVGSDEEEEDFDEETGEVRQSGKSKSNGVDLDDSSEEEDDESGSGEDESDT